MPTSQSLSYTSDLVHRYDYDRFLTSLFAPQRMRERLHTLYAFNTEVARIRETVSEPLIGQMRLQWWRDVLNGLAEGEPPPKGPPVAEALAGLIQDSDLSLQHLEALLNAREKDVQDEPIENVTALKAYCRDTSSTLAWLALQCLGIKDYTTEAAADAIGMAWALTGIARSVRHFALAGKVVLPVRLMEEHTLTLQDLQKPDAATKVAPAVKTLAGEAEEYLRQARAHKPSVDLYAMPVLLQGVLADQYLRTLRRYNFDLYHPRVRSMRPGVVRLWWKAWRKDF